MKIEIQEFYPMKSRDKKFDLTGSLSIYVIDHDLDIRGVSVSRCKGKYFFRLPFRNAFDENGQQIIEDGRKVQYPLVTFASREKQTALMDAIRKEGPAFIESKLKQKMPLDSIITQNVKV